MKELTRSHFFLWYLCYYFSVNKDSYELCSALPLKDCPFTRWEFAALGCGPGMNISHPHLPPQGFMQPEMMMCNLPNSGDMMSSVIPQVSSMAQVIENFI